MLFVPYSYAQNLVQNPGFECGADQCDGTFQAYFFYNQACYWSCPTNGTTDIFSSVIAEPSCYSRMPYAGTNIETSNHIGSISPHSGSRFVGIFTYSPTRSPSYREYLQGSLSAPLVKGQLYCVEFYTALAHRPRYAANNLGIRFYNEYQPPIPNGNPLNVEPNFVDRKVVGELIWTKISGIVKARDTSRYFIIGNFFDDATTEAIARPVPVVQAEWFEYAYYFIDDVSVTPIIEKNFTIAGRTEICKGETAVVVANSTLDAVRWTTLQDTLTYLSTGNMLEASPQVTTDYLVTGKNCGLLVKDTVTVIVNPLPELTLQPDSTICTGTTLVLDAGAGFSSYTWQDGSQNRFIDVNREGDYTVTVTTQFGCTAQDGTKISVITPPVVNLGPDSIVCDEFYPLKASGELTDFTWSTGAKDSVLIPDKIGTYWVIATNQCGVASDTVTLLSYKNVFIPNVITPNGDNKNETFRIVLTDEKQKPMDKLIIGSEVKIVDRWGKQVFESGSYNNDWPGTRADMPRGIYYYSVYLKDCTTYNGWLHIIK